MARKVEKSELPGRPKPAAERPENELEILHPDREIVLGGRKVTVREYRHLEWLQLLPQAEPMVAALAAQLEAAGESNYEQAFEVLAANAEALLPLVAKAANLTVEEAEALPPDDGELLLMSWWGANGRFFVRRALNRVSVRRTEARAREAVRAGASSTPP